METLRYINFLIALFFMVCYSYQLVYIVVSLFFKPKEFTKSEPHRYAVMISARNEEMVIAGLIKSIRAQHYPSELVDIFVVADNCTDNTAQVAKEAGATEVFIRHNKEKVGKGYALNFLFNQVAEKFGWVYDGYFIFDADNLLDENFIEEMNKVFTAGYRVITSYRNSKNYGSNWITAGYSLWFLREARYLNQARMRLGLSCAVSGTGFLVHADIIKKNKGWKHYLLTEDIEFTIDCVVHGEKIGYAHNAIVFDEQPVTFAQSWRQRVRWSKGYLQVYKNYGFSLMRRAVTKGSLSALDMLMTTLPAIVITILMVILNVGIAGTGMVLYSAKISPLILSALKMLWEAYLMFVGIGTLTVVTEWKRIYAKKSAKILYILTFPIFLFTYIPISVVALFKRIEWKPITHDVVKTVEEIKLINKKEL